MIEAIGAVLAAMLAGGLFKAKPYCLWLREAGAWRVTNPAGNSARRCRKAAAEFLELGIEEKNILILAKGITPPKEKWDV